METPKTGLSDPDYAAFAWARYRRLMRWMTLAAAVAVALALVYLKWSVGSLPWQMVLATVAGVGFSVMLGAALMGLVFLSAGTGHDEQIIDLSEDDK